MIEKDWIGDLSVGEVILLSFGIHLLCIYIGIHSMHEAIKFSYMIDGLYLLHSVMGAAMILKYMVKNRIMDKVAFLFTLPVSITYIVIKYVFLY